MSKSNMGIVNEIIAQLKGRLYIKKIDLRNKGIGNYEVHELANALLKNSDSVTTIYLSDNNITDSGMGHLLPALENLPFLQKLSLSRNKNIAGKNLIDLIYFLGSSKTLDTLYLNGIDMYCGGDIRYGLAIKVLITESKTLKNLSLNGCSLTTVIVKMIADGLKINDSLQDISLLDNNITNEGMKYLVPALKTLTSLQKLSLSCKRKEIDKSEDDELLKLINFLENSETLDTLYLDGTEMDIQRGSAIKNLLTNTKTLKYLSLSKCPITNDIAKKIAEGLEENEGLQGIYLSDSGITNVEMGYLVPAFKKLTSLQELSLSHNKIAGEKLLELISFVASSETLNSLFLDGIYIDRSKGGCAIKEFLESTKTLKCLSLRNCGINDYIVELIADGLKINEGLQSLNLFDNSITSLGAEYMLESLKVNHTVTDLSLGPITKHRNCPNFSRTKIQQEITKLLVQRKQEAESKKMQLTEKTEQGQKLEQQEKTKDVSSQVKDEKPMMENIPVGIGFGVLPSAAVNYTEDLMSLIGKDEDNHPGH